MGNKKGFTIVELLIVIVIISILAAISVVAYSGIQQRTRDTTRKSDIATITKALELYYTDKGRYPPSINGSTISGLTSWSTTADTSWQALASSLQQTVSKLPTDPISTPSQHFSTAGTYNYFYYSNSSAGYCGAEPFQMYIIVYRLESGDIANSLNGTCTASTLGPYGSGTSNYRMSKV